jgi:hypothetical protein
MIRVSQLALTLGQLNSSIPKRRSCYRFGWVPDDQIDVSLAKSPSTSSTSLWVHAKCVHPRWKDGGGTDYRLLKGKMQAIMRK